MRTRTLFAALAFAPSLALAQLAPQERTIAQAVDRRNAESLALLEQIGRAHV